MDMGTIRTFVILAALLASPAAVTQEAMAQEATAQAPAEAATGTLVVEANAFTSEKPLPKKVEKQLKSGGLEWGIRENLLVFTMVNKQFVDFPINHMTRYGQSEQLTLPAGDYCVTGIGMEMTAGFNVQKILDRGAFVNEDAVTFRIEPGSVTTLSINPVIKRDNALMVDFWMPTLMVRISGGMEAGEGIAINTRGDKSIAWPQYTGPLKFVPE